MQHRKRNNDSLQNTTPAKRAKTTHYNSNIIGGLRFLSTDYGILIAYVEDNPTKARNRQISCKRNFLQDSRLSARASHYSRCVMFEDFSTRSTDEQFKIRQEQMTNSMLAKIAKNQKMDRFELATQISFATPDEGTEIASFFKLRTGISLELNSNKQFNPVNSQELEEIELLFREPSKLVLTIQREHDGSKASPVKETKYHSTANVLSLLPLTPVAAPVLENPHLEKINQLQTLISNAISKIKAEFNKPLRPTLSSNQEKLLQIKPTILAAIQSYEKAQSVLNKANEKQRTLTHILELLTPIATIANRILDSDNTIPAHYLESLTGKMIWGSDNIQFLLGKTGSLSRLIASRGAEKTRLQAEEVKGEIELSNSHPFIR